MRAALLAGLILIASPLNGTEPLTLSVSPRQSFAPANLFVRLGIEPNAANRSVEVVAESDQFYRSSLVSLEGDRGPKVIQLQFRNLPGGTYEVHGRVTDDRGREVASARHQVNVIDSGVER